MTIKVRLAQKVDCQEIATVLSKAFREFKNNYTEAAYNATVIPPQEVALRIAEGQVWVVFIEEKIVGTIGGIAKNHEYYIRGMGVLPEARGQKVGWLLLKKVEAFARDNHYKSLLLSTTPYLKSAINLYEKFGFSIINEPPFHLFGTPLFSMRKIIVKDKE